MIKTFDIVIRYFTGCTVAYQFSCGLIQLDDISVKLVQMHCCMLKLLYYNGELKNYFIYTIFRGISRL